jgi:hypothetical protein
MILDRKHHRLFLDGAVSLDQRGQTLVGDRVSVNLHSGQTDETGSPLVITAPASSSPQPSSATSPTPSPGPPMLAPIPGLTVPQHPPIPTPFPTPTPTPAPTRSP